MDDDKTPVRVLIVDDRLDKLTALAAVLQHMDVEVVTANSGAEALRRLLAQDFAVVLLDVNMPLMDGFEAARLIRQRPRSAHLPIIFVTAEALADDSRLKGYEIGAVDYIISPVLPQILRAKAATFADLYRLREQSHRDAAELKRMAEAEARTSAEKIAQLERELQGLALLSNQPAKEGKRGGKKKLPAKSGPEVSGNIAERYLELLDQAVERQSYRVEHDISGGLLGLAEELCQFGAGPRDVVEIHSRTLRARVASLKPELKQPYLEEGRLTLLELMGYLANGYRSRAGEIDTGSGD